MFVDLWKKFQKMLGKLWLKFKEILCKICRNSKEILKEIWRQFLYYFFKFVKKIIVKFGNIWKKIFIIFQKLWVGVFFSSWIIACLVKIVSFYFHRFLSRMYILLFFGGVISIFLYLISIQNEYKCCLVK